MAEILVEAFASVYVQEDPQNPSAHQVCSNESPDILVLTEDVLKVLLSLCSSSAMGPDGIHNILLKSCAYDLVAPLTLIISRSLYNCDVLQS